MLLLKFTRYDTNQYMLKEDITAFQIVHIGNLTVILNNTHSFLLVLLKGSVR